MKERIISCAATLAVLLALLSVSRADLHGAQAYACSFQNITSDREAEGFIQIFGMAINKTKLVCTGSNQTFVRPEIVSMAGLGQSDAFNYTPNFADSRLLKDDPVAETATFKPPAISNFGIVISSDQPVSLVGVKSDRGTTDAYLVLPQTSESKEFIIVGWPRIQPEPNSQQPYFLAMIMVIPVLDGTCIELYKNYNPDKFELLDSQILGRYQYYRYFAAYDYYLDSTGEYQQNFSAGEDVTGMKLNASKPIQVIFGHECAWVPTPNDLFCDYAAETIIPKSQAGTSYIVPPLDGRSADAGYIVRVVPTEDNTLITYMNGQTDTKRIGTFLQFDQPSTITATVVTCDKPCLVYQYNKGYLGRDTVPTDPFIMGCVPTDRFTAGAPVGTASFSEDVNVYWDFDNHVSIVTYEAYAPNILFDGSPIAQELNQGLGSVNGWQTVKIGEEKFKVAAFPIDPGFHFFSMSPSTPGSFAVYVYGHSLDPDSSSGYGYFANFNSTGDPVPQVYQDDKDLPDSTGGSPDMNATCQSEAQLVGSIISSNVGQYAPFPFILTAGISPGVDLSPVCASEYHDQLLNLLQQFSRKINYWICISQNCSYLGGQGVAINYPTLSVQYFKTGGVYTSVQIYVEMIARYDVTMQNFANCRADIENYMTQFVNWPPDYTPNLLHQTVDGCPYPIPFQKPMFYDKQNECPAYDY